jgi:hypothetical protein
MQQDLNFKHSFEDFVAVDDNVLDLMGIEDNVMSLEVENVT